jgi:hypothetical protein
MKTGPTLLVLAMSALACGGGTSRPAASQPLDPGVAHYGKTYDQWAAAWVQWVYQWPVNADCSNPMDDPTGELCNLYQDGAGPVFFLTGNWGGVSKRDKCRPPAGKALFIPILVSFQDNGGVPEANLKTDAELERGSEVQADAMSGVSFSLDGQFVEPLAPFAVRAAPYEYTAPPEPNIYTCQGAMGVTGLFKGYTSGYFVLLPPLSSGPHRIAMKGDVNQPGEAPFKLDVTFDPITIP